MEKYLLNLISDASNSVLIKKYIYFLKTNLDELLYGYGDNLNSNYLYPRKITFHYYFSLAKKLLSLNNSSKYQSRNDNILSLVNLPKEDYLNDKILGTILAPSKYPLVNSLELLKIYHYISNILANNGFTELIAEKNCKLLDEFEDRVLKEYKKYDFNALFLGNGENFMCKYHIDIFKQMKRPSLIFLHGLPGIYDVESEKKADYLLVWGEQIRQNYISFGFDAEKIKVIGRPGYTIKRKECLLRNNVSDVLVTTTASVSWRQHGWNYDMFPLYDRSLLILYCYSVQNALKKVGIKNARLRVHPSVNRDWIRKFIDCSFYSLDVLYLNNSLDTSTLVIGPMSTMWIDSYLHGVNYLVYEPGDGKKTLMNFDLVPPFDGSDSDMAIANTEEELISMIQDKYKCDSRIYDKYIVPYNPHIIKQLIND